VLKGGGALIKGPLSGAFRKFSPYLEKLKKVADRPLGSFFRKNPAKTLDDLFAFGGKTTGPRPPRPVEDFVAEPGSLVGPESPPLPRGASTFGDVTQAPLKGHYHKLPAGTELPPGMGVVADGPSVVPNSPHQPTHHTIYPTVPMTVEDFTEKFLNLPWQYGGKK
jgi:hypothetical protein